ncbi:MAG: hypothetical protein JWO59_3240 [Chloroflexi bacterium]|nr:hypothetical protein [Chloroflexota bacterium]
MSVVTDGGDFSAVASVWRQQSVWSQAANQLKASIVRSRTVGLYLAALGALLGTGAAQTASWNPALAKWLAFGAALALAAGPVVGRFAASERTRDWTRLRSVSEALKADVYRFLAGVPPFDDDGRDRELLDRLDRLLKDADDLRRYSSGMTPVVRELPPVTDLRSYVEYRVTAQLDGYYRPKARQMHERVSRFRRIEVTLSLVAAVLAAVAAVYGKEAAASWVAAVTTIMALVTAHGAAERYEYQEIEFSRTADALERLRADRGSTDSDGFVESCESIISVQNEAWMAKLSNPEP